MISCVKLISSFSFVWYLSRNSCVLHETTTRPYWDCWNVVFQRSSLTNYYIIFFVKKSETAITTSVQFSKKWIFVTPRVHRFSRLMKELFKSKVQAYALRLSIRLVQVNSKRSFKHPLKWDEVSARYMTLGWYQWPPYPPHDLCLQQAAAKNRKWKHQIPGTHIAYLSLHM